MGGPNSPNAPALSKDFITDPNDPRIQGFDQSQQKREYMRDSSTQAGQARAQTLNSAAQAMGGSRSSATPGLLASIGAQEGYNQDKELGDLASQSYGQKMSLMDMLNSISSAKNAATTDQYNMQMGQSNANQKQQQANIDNIFKAIKGGGTAAAGGY